MESEAADPLLLGQRVVAILETGLRTATYKLATLMALIEHCIENMPEHPDDVLRVPIPDLAHRVLEIYWQQVHPFDGHELRQSTQPRARILIATNALRSAVGRTSVSVDMAKFRAPEAYQRAIEEITLCLAQQPLHRLQKLPGSSTSDAFLYDDSFLHDHVSRLTLRAQGDAIELKPGVAHGLARLAGLLKPALEIGTLAARSLNACVVSCAASTNAAVHPTVANAIAFKSRGASRSAGGASSNVNTDARHDNSGSHSAS